MMRKRLATLCTVFLMLSSISFMSVANAATNIVVNSNSDLAVDDGLCTLREAIASANSDSSSGATSGECQAGSGIDTILFQIIGTPDFVINGQNGYTIKPNSNFETISETVIIDGYSQPGAKPNTAISPRPLNGTLLIELDGENAGSVDGLDAGPTSNGTEILGLVINSFEGRGVGSNQGGPNTKIQGNYIGTDPTGMIDKGNISTGVQVGAGALIGGLNPRDRNIISGNTGGGASPNVTDTGWTVQGNFIGVGADGKTSIPNSRPNDTGALSIDNSDNHLVGGTAVGATNVISGNNSYAIFPDNTNNLVVQGNILGPDWQGNPILNNPQPGGIGFPPLNGDMRNALVGGVRPSAKNIIAHNNGPGIFVLNGFRNGTPIALSDNISILGNSIFSNNRGDFMPTDLGIDIGYVDFGLLRPYDLGPNPNDTGDLDSGANDYLNYPVLNSTEVINPGKLSINFDLDVPSNPDGYRVEFFASGEADESNYGEGQYFLGYANVEGKINNSYATLNIPSQLVDGSYAISSTTTERDSSTDGFGSTSEFSQVLIDQSFQFSSDALTGNKDVIPTTGISESLIFVGLFEIICGMILLRISRKLETAVE